MKERVVMTNQEIILALLIHLVENPFLEKVQVRHQFLENHVPMKTIVFQQKEEVRVQKVTTELLQVIDYRLKLQEDAFKKDNPNVYI